MILISDARGTKQTEHTLCYSHCTHKNIQQESYIYMWQLKQYNF